MKVNINKVCQKKRKNEETDMLLLNTERQPEVKNKTWRKASK